LTVLSLNLKLYFSKLIKKFCTDVEQLCASKTLVQAFVSCHLDYCNSLFFGISEGLMNRLNRTGYSRFRTLPPVWLLAPDAPITYRQCSISYTGYQRQRIDFKVATLVHQ